MIFQPILFTSPFYGFASHTIHIWQYIYIYICDVMGLPLQQTNDDEHNTVVGEVEWGPIDEAQPDTHAAIIITITTYYYYYYYYYHYRHAILPAHLLLHGRRCDSDWLMAVVHWCPAWAGMWVGRAVVLYECRWLLGNPKCLLWWWWWWW